MGTSEIWNQNEDLSNEGLNKVLNDVSIKS